jgi:hypothetical protein
MPSRAGLLRSRIVHVGGYVVGVAIGERIFRPSESRASLFGSVLSVGREEVAAARWELGRANDARLAVLFRRLIVGDRGSRRLRWSGRVRTSRTVRPSVSR